jgi:hypothetical protein
VFAIGHRLRNDAGSASRVRDDVLGDVPKPKLIRHETPHLVVAGAVGARDRDDIPGHTADVTPPSKSGQT